MVMRDTDTSFSWKKLTLGLCVVCGLFCRLCAQEGEGEAKQWDLTLLLFYISHHPLLRMSSAFLRAQG